MDLVDILYEIKFNETNFTAIGELVFTTVENRWFEILTLFYMIFMVAKFIELEHYFQSQMDLLDARISQNANEMSYAYDKIKKELENKLTFVEYRLDVMHERLCDKILVEAEPEKAEESEEEKCNQLVKDVETRETAFCKNQPLLNSDYCGLHKKNYEFDEEFKSLISTSEDSDEL